VKTPAENTTGQIAAKSTMRIKDYNLQLIPPPLNFRAKYSRIQEEEINGILPNSCRSIFLRYNELNPIATTVYRSSILLQEDQKPELDSSRVLKTPRFCRRLEEKLARALSFLLPFSLSFSSDFS